MELKPKKFAVLIDADNSSVNSIDAVLQEIAKYGIASVKRVYGDWSSETLKNWREVLLPHAITPVQQFAYTKGKDATDMILIIDAMDLLYSGALDGFCIVSSDSDFTPLASRIRESGLMVYGFGRKKTPEAFKKACDKFIFVENLVEEQERVRNNSESNIEASDAAIKPASKQHDIQKSDSVNSEVTLGSDDKKDIPTDVPIIDRATLNLIYKAVKDNTEDNGWANLSLVGQYLTAVKPDFDSRNYGRAKLSGLIKLLNLFETKIEDSQMYLKKKKKTGV